MIKRKRFHLISCLVLLIMVLILPVCPVKAKTITEGKWTYDIIQAEGKDYARIISYKGTETNVKVPEKLGGYPVSLIGNSWNAVFHKNIETVTMPSGVRKLDAEAFEECTSLTSISAPGVETVGSGAFIGCTSLEKVYLPKLTRIDFDAFNNCTSLKQMDHLENMIYIDYRAFQGSGLTGTITVSGRISNLAFADCKNLTEIVIKDEAILGDCILQNSGVKRAVIGENIKTISYENKKEAYGAFKGCDALESVKIGRILNGGEYFFDGCEKLASVEFSPKVRTIPKGMFRNCRSLTFIEFPDEVERIDYGAFQGAEQLSSVKWSKRLLDLDVYSFHGTALTNIDLPDHVTSINPDPFPESITSLSIPNSVSYLIMEWEKYKNLQTISCYEDTYVSRCLNEAKEEGKLACDIVYLPSVPATSISITPSVTSEAGKEVQLQAKMEPENSTDAIVWTSEDRFTARVDGNGLLLPLEPGTTVITAETSSGQKATCNVTVTHGPDRIAFESKECQIEVGQKKSYKATVYAGDQVYEGPRITYSSSNSDVVKVEANGDIYGCMEGKASVFASFVDNFGERKLVLTNVTVNKAKAIEAKPKKLKATTVKVKLNGTMPLLEWKAVKGAVAYGIFRKTSSDSKYIEIKRVKNTKWTDNILKLSKTSKVSYIVKPYYTSSNGVVWGKASKSVSCTVKVKSTTPTINFKKTYKKTKTNGITSFSKDCYELYFEELSSGISAKDYASCENYPGFDEYKLTRFAIAGTDGNNPYLLLAGDCIDKDQPCECMYIFSFLPGEDITDSAVVDTKCRLGQGQRQLSIGSYIFYNQLFLNNQSNSIVFTRIEHEGGSSSGAREGYDDYNVYHYDQKLNSTWVKGNKSTMKNGLKNGAYSKIKWYKITEIEKAKKELKKYVDKK